MFKHSALLVLAGAAVCLLSSCKGYEDLSAADSAVRIARDRNLQILDVRTPEEYNAGHIPGAANIDWLADGFIDQARAGLDPARPVLAYCRTGKRSAEASAKLASAGFDVLNLKGGYVAWTEGERPVLTAADEELDVKYAVELLAPGTPAPDFTLGDVDGKEVSFSDFRGRNVVLVFWASWCPDCRAEIPDLKKMAAAADPEQVQFVSVSYDRAFDTLCAFVKEQELPGVQLFDPAGKQDSEVGAAYGVKWIPSLYLIDPDGKVVFGTVLAPRIAAALGSGATISLAAPAPTRELCADDSCAE
jgi:rhodanese-related sulfurtransferase/peroxiredoxin